MDIVTITVKLFAMNTIFLLSLLIDIVDDQRKPTFLELGDRVHSMDELRWFLFYRQKIGLTIQRRDSASGYNPSWIEYASIHCELLLHFFVSMTPSDSHFVMYSKMRKCLKFAFALRLSLFQSAKIEKYEVFRTPTP